MERASGVLEGWRLGECSRKPEAQSLTLKSGWAWAWRLESSGFSGADQRFAMANRPIAKPWHVRLQAAWPNSVRRPSMAN